MELYLGITWRRNSCGNLKRNVHPLRVKTGTNIVDLSLEALKIFTAYRTQRRDF